MAQHAERTHVYGRRFRCVLRAQKIAGAESAGDEWRTRTDAVAEFDGDVGVVSVGETVIESA